MAVHLGKFPGWPGYLGISGYLNKGEYMAVHPGIIPGWPGYLGIPGYLDKEGSEAPSLTYRYVQCMFLSQRGERPVFPTVVWCPLLVLVLLLMSGS